ncbi:hypothetical protein KP509_25G051900 [Ceratopteris richardii]|uniref:Calcium homeostasis endoplasmic reticulum protein n=1 Tax=Ceratopteris richardii TaxID=49495 RepID=A0A8T2RT03_CERRI|nr:hypothetical protein KP509_25G051900 [Ceratopteris richardii]
MDHGYGGHPYGTGPQQFPPPPPSMHGVPQHFGQGAAPPAFFPGPPAAAGMPGFPPYGPSMPYPPPAAGPFVPPPAPIQQQAPPPIVFFNPWEPPPPIVPPPADQELQKRIEKLVEYAAKNGPEFEKMLKEKQKDNPLYAFLFGAEGYAYYRYKLWVTVNPHLGGPFMNPPPMPSISAANPNFNPAMAPMNPNIGPVNPVLNPINASLHPVVPPFYEQPHPISQPPLHPPFFDHTYPESMSKSFKGLSGPLPGDVAMELQNVLENLTGTKESIKGAKNWFMQRLPFAPALAEALRERVLALDDDIRQLHVIYLANDILFDSLQRRLNIKELDNEALAFQPVLGSMLAAIYFNPKNKEANQTRLQKILQFWGSKEVYSKEIITALENEMMAGPPTPYRATQGMSSLPQVEKSMPMPANLPGAVALPESISKAEHVRALTPEQPSRFQSPSKKEDTPLLTTLTAVSFGLSSSIGTSVIPQTPVDAYPAVNPPFLGTLTSSTPTAVSQPTPQVAAPARPPETPPYPLFPPGLIPGMIRKMQIGTGVPYSALSPLDIPAVIPPSTASDSYILNRVAKFFKDIGEVDPMEGHVTGRASSIDEDDRDERDRGGRTGGARIPPPASLNVDPETNTLPDGSIEHKPGSISSGRLGLGAVADPNEITQYDDVYTSYRKQRSSSYHTFMSARAAAR